MTPERKAEVNLGLATFEFGSYGGAPADGVNYTADLNAVARLEAKLPPHNWASVRALNTSPTAPERQMWEMWSEGDDGFMGGGTESTEAEARAEAICQYLESKDGK